MLVRRGGRALHALALGWHAGYIDREKSQKVFPCRELYSHELSSHVKLLNSLLLGKNIVQDLGQVQLKLGE